MIVTVDDFLEYLGMAEKADQRLRRAAEQMLAGVQAELEGILGNRLEVSEFADELCAVYDGGRVVVRNKPLVSVDSVSVDGQALISSQYKTGRSGVVVTVRGATATITYTAGYADAADNPQVQLAIKRAAARELRAMLDDAQGLDRLIIEGYDAVYAKDLFTDKELKRLGRYRRVMAG